jgi:hypothetical protein
MGRSNIQYLYIYRTSRSESQIATSPKNKQSISSHGKTYFRYTVYLLHVYISFVIY